MRQCTSPFEGRAPLVVRGRGVAQQAQRSARAATQQAQHAGTHTSGPACSRRSRAADAADAFSSAMHAQQARQPRSRAADAAGAAGQPRSLGSHAAWAATQQGHLRSMGSHALGSHAAGAATQSHRRRRCSRHQSRRFDQVLALPRLSGERTVLLDEMPSMQARLHSLVDHLCLCHAQKPRGTGSHAAEAATQHGQPRNGQPRSRGSYASYRRRRCLSSAASIRC